MSFFKKKSIHAFDHEGRDTGPYLIRWALSTPIGEIKLHHILRSDEDRGLHDHPWSFLSLILWGGYWEHTPLIESKNCKYDIRIAGKPITIRRWHGLGSVLWRPAPSPHRLELPAGRSAWTLVFTGAKKREWGFRTICGWIPWTEYSRVKREGC